MEKKVSENLILQVFTMWKLERLGKLKSAIAELKMFSYLCELEQPYILLIFQIKLSSGTSKVASLLRQNPDFGNERKL